MVEKIDDEDSGASHKSFIQEKGKKKSLLSWFSHTNSCI